MNNEASLVNFLETSPLAFQMTHFTIKSNHINTFSAPLTMAQPQNATDEDWVVSKIQIQTTLGKTVFVPSYEITFESTSVPDDTDYYALGYPGCDHYDTNDQSEAVQNMGFYPLFITRAFHEKNKKHVTFQKGLVTHSIPTAPGMSGGAFVLFSKQLYN